MNTTTQAVSAIDDVMNVLGEQVVGLFNAREFRPAFHEHDKAIGFWVSRCRYRYVTMYRRENGRWFICFYNYVGGSFVWYSTLSDVADVDVANKFLKHATEHACEPLRNEIKSLKQF
jgi:hypothetical protein